MKFLIAGFGSIGRRHMRNLLALGEKDIILYRTHNSTLPDDELAGFPVEYSLEAALRHRPDAVIVSNPTALHLDVAIPAAQAGCHILLEKPVSHSLERLDVLQKVMQASGSRVLVAFQFRFHPGLQTVERLLKDGAIGNACYARVNWGEYLPGWHPWEDYRKSYSARSDLGGGVALTLCHPLDYLPWLLGDAEMVYSYGARLSDLEIQVEDTAEIGMRFRNGALGSIHLDYYQRPGGHWLEISGTTGSLRWDNSDGAVRVFRSQTGVWESFPAPDGFERNHLFLSETRHFLEVAKGEAQPVCTLEDGIRALKFALGASKAG